MKVLATYSIKGGVGKTTTAVNLAHEAAASGSRVLLWDLDPQGAATFFVRVKPSVKGGAERLVSEAGSLAANIRATDDPAVHIVPADFSLRHLDLELDDTKRPTRRLAALLEPIADRYDVALLDCPPGITLTSESVFGAADALIVPTIPTTLSERTLDQLTDFLADAPAGTDGPAVRVDARSTQTAAARDRRPPDDRHPGLPTDGDPECQRHRADGNRTLARRRLRPEAAQQRSRSDTCGPTSPHGSGPDRRERGLPSPDFPYCVQFDPCANTTCVVRPV